MNAPVVVGTIVDPDDFCRMCGGTGTQSEYLGHGRMLIETCDQCRGSGRRTVLITEKRDV